MAAPMYTGAQPSQWRERTAVDLDELREWKYLTVLQSSSVEPLREWFDRMTICGVEPLYRLEVKEEVIHKATQSLLGQWSLSPSARFHLASLKF